MTITVLVPNEEGRAALAEVDGVNPVRYEPGEPLEDHMREAQVLVPPFLAGPKVSEMFAELPRLRLIQLLSAGAENWTGLVPQGVALSTCRGAHGGATAEWVFATLLSIYRELEPFAADRARRVWDQHYTETLMDKRVLVVGAGDLGEQLRRRFEAFDAHATLVGTRARDGVHGVDELPGLLPVHEVTVLVVPLTSATRGMVDAKFLAAMPDGAVLVNAARGPVVRTEALLAELNAGRLRAALDVTDPEPLPEGHALWSAPNLVLTPHVGGSVTGGQVRAWRVAAAEIGRFAAGLQPGNLVDGEY
ncbi:2-hydroxyacid dehydrogenase [Sciscionella marina]|uniref:2-hydroxyacid dehydrogenase n=1 Tax=Sciscionella marina TaxID=508770 RepID=UPI000363E550|nr:2-hydroxyacid dehydrogenase [Sciscionella marina]